MLWRKESAKRNAMYVDIFALNGGKEVLDAMCRPYRANGPAISKSEMIALQKREDGNDYFAKRAYVDAMLCYNDCLRFAALGSKQICLAYANRSACFLHMKLYNECLADIELAKKAGYPEHKMPKLDQRQIDCVARIEKGEEKCRDMFTKLSFDADERFPCMANVVKIERSNTGELTMFAKENIDAGQTIIVEKAFATKLMVGFGSKCQICLREDANLMPCEKCTIAMFCSDECQSSYLHQYECGFKYSDENVRDSRMLENLRLSLMAINMFTTANEMMGFVVRALESDPKELPEALSDVRSQYRGFLKLPIHEPLNVVRNEACQHYEVYRMLLNFPNIKSMFQLEKHRRFLMHLIAHHYLVSRHNSTQHNMGHPNEEKVEVCSQISLITHYFEHSCAPNCLMGTYHGSTFFITLRPIMKRSKLLMSKLMILTEDTAKRQQILWEQREIICKCTRCKGPCTASTEQRLQVAADPDLTLIASTDIITASTEELRSMIDKCAAFSMKYGKVPWCDEIAIFCHFYIRLVNVFKRGYRIGPINSQI